MGRRAIALAMIAVGIVLALPIILILATGLRAGPNLIVLAPNLAWLFYAVPAAGLLGGALVGAGAWMAVSRSSRP